VSNVNATHVPMDSMARPKNSASDTEMNATVSSGNRSHSLSRSSLAQGSHLSHSALLDITNRKGDKDDSNIASDGTSKPKSKTKETVTTDSSSSALLLAHGNATASAVFLKRSADDLDSVSSNSSSSHADHPLNISNTSPDSDQDTKRQRSTSSSSNSGSSNTSINTSIHMGGSTSRSFDSNEHGKQGLLHLLCEATDIVTMRMGKAVPQNTSASNSQHLSHHPKYVSAMGQDPKNPSFTIGDGAGNPVPVPVAVAIPFSIRASAKTTEKGESKNCNCPRSRCIKLYCECFQAGRYCSAECCCKMCLNSESESGPGGKRTLSVQNILARNPFAFHKDKALLEKKNNRASGINCRCVKSQCLKLYCDCFQSGVVCGNDCMCVKCLNTVEESGDYGEVTKARALRICRNPDAFKKKTKKTGEGCSCKNSKCLKKYCDCFNNGLSCTPKCSCRDCQNYAPVMDGQLKRMADV